MLLVAMKTFFVEGGGAVCATLFGAVDHQNLNDNVEIYGGKA